MVVVVRVKIQPAQQIAWLPEVAATWCSLILLHSNSILSSPKTTTCSFCTKASRSLKGLLSQIRAKIQRRFPEGSPRKNAFKTLFLVLNLTKRKQITCIYPRDNVSKSAAGKVMRHAKSPTKDQIALQPTNKKAAESCEGLSGLRLPD